MNFLSYTAGAARYFLKLGGAGFKVFNTRLSREKRVIEAKIPQLKHPIYLRTNSSDIGIFDQIFYHDYYKYHYNLEPKVILDCGANIGMGTVFFKNLFPEARIIAVEPDLSNFQMLKKNVAAYDNIECLQMGIWPQSAFLEITNRHHDNPSGFMVEEVAERSDKTIEAISIQDIMQRYELKTIDILKMDIEGSEKEVFEKNFTSWLPHVKMLVIEIHDFMKPGCAKSLFTALNHYDYNLEFWGDSFFCRIGG